MEGIFVWFYFYFFYGLSYSLNRPFSTLPALKVWRYLRTCKVNCAPPGSENAHSFVLMVLEMIFYLDHLLKNSVFYFKKQYILFYLLSEMRVCYGRICKAFMMKQPIS